MSDNPTTAYRARAIEPGILEALRRRGRDGLGNVFAPSPAHGWEPLRCCLRSARAGEPVALISYTPFAATSAWTEWGPVYVHGEACDGYSGEGLPDELRTGPRVLRTYRADETLAYEHIAYVPDGEDVAAALDTLFAEPEVAFVHVRAALSQCFTYAVTR